MATLRQLAQKPSPRPHDDEHYRHLRGLWQGLVASWADAGRDDGTSTAAYAVILAFLYKGQTDYPDGGHMRRLLDLLRQAAALDPAADDGWADVLMQMASLPGMRVPRASMLLHCLHPDDFPIVDRRAAHSLHEWASMNPAWFSAERVPVPAVDDGAMAQTADGYLQYRRTLLALVRASRGALSLRDVEFALYIAEDEPIAGI